MVCWYVCLLWYVGKTLTAVVILFRCYFSSLTKTWTRKPEKTADIPRHHLWFPWEMTSGERLQKFHTDDVSQPRSGSASDWSCRVGNLLRPIRSTTPMCAVTRHQYGITALVSQSQFCGATIGGVGKCRLFFQAVNKKASRPSSPVPSSRPKAMTKVRYTYTRDDYLPWPAAFFSNCAV